VPFHEGLLRHKFDAWAFRALSRILRDGRIDLIYTFTHPNTVILSSLAAARGLVGGFVVSYHAMGNPEGGRLVPGYLKPFLSRAAVLLAVADMHKRYLVDVEGLPVERIEVIHNGVDTEKYRPGTKADEPAVCAELGIAPGDVVMTTIASLKPAKRIDAFLEAAAPVIRANERAGVRVKIVLCGDGPARGGLGERSAALGIGDNVVFAGIRDDVDHVLRASDALVLPSRRGTETFPNVVLEAMASGVAVLTTDVGSVREMVEDGESAIVVPSDDTAALGDAIARLAGDAALRARLGRRGREIVEERFRIEQMCEAREALFERLIARGAAPGGNKERAGG
jgi:glycosyltransferase involved in cell wall biosynthesis